jgi:hypothetical protein
MVEASAEHWGYRIGGDSAVVGAILGAVGNLLHPATSGPGHAIPSASEELEEWAGRIRELPRTHGRPTS